MSIQRFAVLLSLALAPAASSSAQQFVLAFDDLAALRSHVGESYAAQGVHFVAWDYGLEDGTGYTDDGNWGLAGTRGSWFLGFNGSPEPVNGMILTFDHPVEGFALDVARANWSQDGDTFRFLANRGPDFVDDQTVTLPAVGSWVTVSSAASGIDQIWWYGERGFHPYGVDNIRFSFVPQLDRFKCYKAKDTEDPAKFAGARVILEDSLERKITNLRKPIAYCEPVNQDGAGTVNSQARLICYQIKDAKTRPKQAKFDKRQLVAADDFGELGLLLSKSTTLCEPATEVP